MRSLAFGCAVAALSAVHAATVSVPGFLPETVVIAPGDGVATNVSEALSGRYNVQAGDGALEIQPKGTMLLFR